MNTLFSGSKLSEYLRECEKAAINEVAQLGTTDFAAKSINELAQEISIKYTPQPLVIKYDEMNGVLEQADIDTNQFSHHMPHTQKKNPYVKGLRLTVKLPFGGLQKILDLKPTFAQLTSQYPPGNCDESAIIMTFEDIRHDVEALNRRVSEQVALITQFADSANKEIGQVDFLPVVTKASQDRKAELEKLQGSVAKFSFSVEFAG